jgi:hypothetical protein
MQYSPKLKNAMAQIKAILEAHDIAGSIVLHEPGFGEHLLRIDPSWSCAKFNPVHKELKFQAQVSDFKNAAEAKKKIESTLNMFKIMADLNGQMTLCVMDMSDRLEERYKPTHFIGGHTTQQEQNN